MENHHYVRSGAITHQDNLGNRGRTEAGDVQVMTPATASSTVSTTSRRTARRFFQIWILPNRHGEPPAWGAKPFRKAIAPGRFVALAQRLRGRPGRAADPHRCTLCSAPRSRPATRRSTTSPRSAYGYLVPAKGAVEVNGVRLDARDGAAIREVDSFASPRWRCRAGLVDSAACRRQGSAYRNHACHANRRGSFINQGKGAWAARNTGSFSPCRPCVPPLSTSSTITSLRPCGSHGGRTKQLCCGPTFQ